MEENKQKKSENGNNSKYSIFWTNPISERDVFFIKKYKRKFDCPFENCLKKFVEKGNLRSHIRTHTGERPFICKFGKCHKKFATLGNLKAHELNHINYKPYHCNFEGCTNRYTRASRLDIHIRTHTGNKPYKCFYYGCNKSFNEKGNLKTHIRIHTGEKPYVCWYQYCRKSFKAHGHLKDHLKTHDKPRNYTLNCEFCGIFFEKRILLKNHLRLHSIKNKKKKIINQENTNFECDKFKDITPKSINTDYTCNSRNKDNSKIEAKFQDFASFKIKSLSNHSIIKRIGLNVTNKFNVFKSRFKKEEILKVEENNKENENEIDQNKKQNIIDHNKYDISNTNEVIFIDECQKSTEKIKDEDGKSCKNEIPDIIEKKNINNFLTQEIGEIQKNSNDIPFQDIHVIEDSKLKKIIDLLDENNLITENNYSNDIPIQEEKKIPFILNRNSNKNIFKNKLKKSFILSGFSNSIKKKSVDDLKDDYKYVFSPQNQNYLSFYDTSFRKNVLKIEDLEIIDNIPKKKGRCSKNLNEGNDKINSNISSMTKNLENGLLIGKSSSPNESKIIKSYSQLENCFYEENFISNLDEDKLDFVPLETIDKSNLKLGENQFLCNMDNQKCEVFNKEGQILKKNIKIDIKDNTEDDQKITKKKNVLFEIYKKSLSTNDFSINRSNLDCESKISIVNDQKENKISNLSYLNTKLNLEEDINKLIHNNFSNSKNSHERSINCSHNENCENNKLYEFSKYDIVSNLNEKPKDQSFFMKKSHNCENNHFSISNDLKKISSNIEVFPKNNSNFSSDIQEEQSISQNNIKRLSNYIFCDKNLDKEKYKIHMRIMNSKINSRYEIYHDKISQIIFEILSICDKVNFPIKEEIIIKKIWEYLNFIHEDEFNEDYDNLKILKLKNFFLDKIFDANLDTYKKIVENMKSGEFYKLKEKFEDNDFFEFLNCLTFKNNFDNIFSSNKTLNSKNEIVHLLKFILSGEDFNYEIMLENLNISFTNLNIILINNRLNFENLSKKLVENKKRLFIFQKILENHSLRNEYLELCKNQIEYLENNPLFFVGNNEFYQKNIYEENLKDGNILNSLKNYNENHLKFSKFLSNIQEQFDPEKDVMDIFAEFQFLHMNLLEGENQKLKEYYNKIFLWNNYDLTYPLNNQSQLTREYQKNVIKSSFDKAVKILNFFTDFNHDEYNNIIDNYYYEKNSILFDNYHREESENNLISSEDIEMVNEHSEI